MKRYLGYKIAVWILSLLVVFEGIYIFTLTHPKKIPPAVLIKGRIAIVIDDWGYNLDNLPLTDEIKYPLTASVLPHLVYSEAIARHLDQRGWEVILHLPMEPKEKFRLERNTIMTSMSEQAIIRIMEQDLKGVPYAKGVSNHMGSRAIEDSRTMEIIFRELKRRQLYFLDSLVSAKSLGRVLAKKLHLDFAERDVFLDNEENPGYIKGQIAKLKTKASLYGQAIGIGHDRKVTLEVLKEIMPQLDKEGYKFVFVSELVR